MNTTRYQGLKWMSSRGSSYMGGSVRSWSVRLTGGSSGGGGENWVVGGSTIRLEIGQLEIRKESVGKFHWFGDPGWLKFWF